MKKIFLIIFLLFTLQVFAQQQNNNVYIIDNIDFNITGRTRQYAILRNIELNIGDEVTGLANLQKFVQDKEQELINQRVLESASIEYTIGNVRPDGKYPVNLVITTKDTWSIIPIPYPKYDTNTGFEIIVKIRDYNFFGTMQPLRVDVGFRNDELNRTFYHIMAETTFPFMFLGYHWNANIYSKVQYRPDMSEPWYFHQTLGLSISIPFKTTTIEIGTDESFKLHEEISDDYKYHPVYGYTDVHKGFYFSTNPYISWNIPLGIEIGNYGTLGYNPYLSFTMNHEIADYPLPVDRIGPWLRFSHSLGFGKVNWYGNFRSGLSVSLGNSLNYDFYAEKLNAEPFTYSFNFDTKIFKPFGDHLGIYARLLYRQYFNTQNDSSADVLRGIVDKNISSDFMLSLNFNITVAAMKARPSGWGDSRILKVFDFDLHASPFIDVAIFRDPALERDPETKNAHFTYKNMLFCGGLEVIVYPLFMRSVQLRASLGFNFSALSGLSSRELYIGTELFF